MTTRSHPQVIFANTVNELMTATPAPDPARYLTAVSPRKLWLAKEYDLLITPHAIDDEFKNYVVDLLDIKRHPQCISPKGDDLTYLAERLDKTGCIDAVSKYLDNNPDAKFLCFALDDPTLRLI